MTEKARFNAIAEILEVPNDGEDSQVNPYLSLARFVFADDKGASTSTSIGGIQQGIEAEDFDEVIKTAIHMPVKMNLLGESVGSHTGSYVIGHIKKMTKQQTSDGTNQLIADAVLYKDEYPEEVQFLKDKYDIGDAPGVSYELAYAGSVVKNGVQWLKDLVTCAATFVRSPAYGKRTALLALASAKDEDFVHTMKTLIAQADSSTEPIIPSNKGGNTVDELEKAIAEVERFKAEAATKTAEISTLTEQITAKDQEINTLTSTVATLQKEKTIESRIRKFTEAGFTLEADAEKAEKKQNFWLSLSDEAFEEYISDMVSAAKAAKESVPSGGVALASLRTAALPKLEVPADSTNGLSFRFRDIN